MTYEILIFIVWLIIGVNRFSSGNIDATGYGLMFIALMIYLGKDAFMKK